MDPNRFTVPVAPPGWQPAPVLASVPPLQAPVWGQQPGETIPAFQGFVAWLGNGPRGDWREAERSTGWPRDSLERLAKQFAWEVRAREYWQHLRRLAYDAAQPLREQLEAMHAQRARTHQLALDLEELELKKLLMRARGENAPAGSPEGLPEQLDVRSLARLRQVNASVSEQLRREAQGIAPSPSVDDGSGIAWDKLSDTEAEAYRELRSKAGLG